MQMQMHMHHSKGTSNVSHFCKSTNVNSCLNVDIEILLDDSLSRLKDSKLKIFF